MLTSEALVEAAEVQRGQWQYYRNYPLDDLRLWATIELVFMPYKYSQSSLPEEDTSGENMMSWGLRLMYIRCTQFLVRSFVRSL